MQLYIYFVILKEVIHGVLTAPVPQMTTARDDIN